MKNRLILVAVLILCGSVLIFGQTSDAGPNEVTIGAAALIIATLTGAVLKWGKSRVSGFKIVLIGIAKVGHSLWGFIRVGKDSKRK